MKYMNKKMNLTTNSYPQIVQAFAKENFNLKVLSSVCLGLVFLSLALIAFLVKRGPTVIALDNTGEIARVESKVTDLQIQAAAKEYLVHRYSWDDKTISDELKKAEFFVQGNLVPSFQKSMLETIKYVHEKKVRQRLYPKQMTVDLKEKTISVVADRITEFDGLKAATETKVKIWFDIDDRSVINPWGVYVTKELESAGAQ
jgi:hypothetical protein